MQAKVYKDIRGNWTAMTYLPFQDGRVIRVATHKNYNGELVTTASAVKIEGKMETHMLYGDFSARVTTSRLRCTEKNVSAQHMAALERADDMVYSAEQFYKNKVVA